MTDAYIHSNKRDRIAVDVNLAPINASVKHGIAKKDMVVLHETVSPDYKGLSDIVQTSRYLANEGLGIHGVVDAEGYLGWSVGDASAVLYHTASNGGNINTRSIGIEQVSRVMLDYPDNTSRWKKWWSRNAEIDKVAQVLAFLSHTHKIPLVYSDGRKPGITAHWQVSRTYNVPGGHTDCWPRHLGGYYPMLRVIKEAKAYYAKWYAAV